MLTANDRRLLPRRNSVLAKALHCIDGMHQALRTHTHLEGRNVTALCRVAANTFRVSLVALRIDADDGMKRIQSTCRIILTGTAVPIGVVPRVVR